MESPPSSARGAPQTEFDSSLPFAGVVVCCTSIPAEHRTYIAERVKEFGGVHKYDLTPDVTHLIVGEYDTAKYRHVARERPDIKPMAAGWINAVRTHWVNDQDFDFAKLESEHQLQTFESSGGFPESPLPQERQRQRLLICLTGFEEHDRQYIEQTVIDNGGDYVGDLSRKVTHLIVCKPEGKKYQAAKNWNITTVSIEWVKDSVSRGMILDESCYDPVLPEEDRGKGAILRKELKRISTGGKRTRQESEPTQQNGPRKLRKSASMRLSSQGNNLLNEILGSKQPPAHAPRPALEQRSMSTLAFPPLMAIHAPKALPVTGISPSLPAPTADPTQAADGVFAACRFMIYGFSDKKREIIYDYLTSHGGRIANSLNDLALPSHYEPQDQRFLVVPQTSQPSTHPSIPEPIHIVTEFYIERCIHGRRLLHPHEHVLGRPFTRFPISGFEELSIHSTGFRNEQLNQVEKTIVQIGAKYAERFNSQSSLMLCPSLRDVRTGKLDLALRNNIPVVNAEWLWHCISTGVRAPWDAFIFPEVQHRVSIDVDPELNQQRQKIMRPRSESRRHKESMTDALAPLHRVGLDTTAFSEDKLPVVVDMDLARNIAKPKVAPIKAQEENSAIDISKYNTAPTHQERDGLDNGPLSELGLNALNQPSTSPSKSTERKSLRRFPTGGTIGHSEGGDDSDAATIRSHSIAPENVPVRPTPSQLERIHQHKVGEEKAAERAAMAKQLTSLMHKPAADEVKGNNTNTNLASGPNVKRRKREILGRAVSNASAASSTSAESLAPMSKPVKTDQAQSVTGSIGILDEMLSGERTDSDKPEDVTKPPATQIGYDDAQAQRHREEVMDRIQGRKKSAGADQARDGQEKACVELPITTSSTAASRRPRRKVL